MATGRIVRLVIESSMGALLHRFLPVLAVKIVRLQQREVNIIDAACIDVDLVRLRTRHVERMDAAVLAERMLGHSCVKRIGRLNHLYRRPTRTVPAAQSDG